MLELSGLTVPSDQALVLWTQVAVLLVCARLLGGLARRLGQPALVGALVAGVALGPSVLGRVWPSLGHWFVPRDQPAQLHLLGAITGFSLLVLAVVLGTEVDLGLLRRLGRAAGTVSLGSIVLPGLATVAAVWPLAAELSPGSRNTLLLAVAIGGALSVSSLPIVAQIVMDLRLSRRDLGQLALAVAGVNDVYGFLLLAALVVLAGTGGLGGVLLPVAGLLVLVVLLPVPGQRVVDRLLRRVRSRGGETSAAVAVTLGVGLALAALTQAFRMDAALGAFVAGVLLGRSRLRHTAALRSVAAMVSAVFAPLYFASAGLQIDLGLLAHPGVIAAVAIVLVVAVASKYAGALAGAAAGGLPSRDGSALGVVLNARGAMQIIIGSAALRIGLIDQRGFTALVIVSLVAATAVSPVLDRLVTRWPGTREEQRRLAREEQLANNVFVRQARLLLPMQDCEAPLDAALVIDRVWPPEAELTALGVREGCPAQPAEVLGGLMARPVREVARPEMSLSAAIAAESRLGYDLLAVGLVPGQSVLPDWLVTLFDTGAPPTLLVRRGRGPAAHQPRRILVPVHGTRSSRAGVEVAAELAQASGAEVLLLHVESGHEPRLPSPPAGPLPPGTSGAPPSTTVPVTDAVLGEALELAGRLGARASGLHRAGAPVGPLIAEVVRQSGAGALVLGTRLRRVGGHVLLGETVNQILAARLDAALVLAVLPEQPDTTSA